MRVEQPEIGALTAVYLHLGPYSRYVIGKIDAIALEPRAAKRDAAASSAAAA